MSFMKKILSSVGIGAAKVDTQLHGDEFRAGEKISGEIVITGGNIEQEISSVYISVMTTYEKEVDDNKVTKNATIVQEKLFDSMKIAAGEMKVVPFEMGLPTDTPVTVGNSKVWVQTGLDIKNAVDPQDRDYIKVIPNECARRVLEAIELLGFSVRKVKNEAASHKLRQRLPFVQEFEFYPVQGQFSGKLDELEVIFLSTEEKCELLMEIDRKAKGLGGFLAEVLDADESLVRLTFTNEDIDSVKHIIEDVIQKHS
jgi:sporulation-control protein